MKDVLKSFFEAENIEYYATLSYECLDVCRAYLTEREGLVPRSAVIFLIPYFSVEGVNLSSYAVARDYHAYIRSVTERLSTALSAVYPEYKYLGFGDHSPINERRAASIAGLGILGDNGLLINERYGSYVFIAELITDAPPELLGEVAPREPLRCSGCSACIAACPTGRLSSLAPCLSEITQRKGELSEEEISLMLSAGTVWGCDACQRVCPHNQNAKSTPIKFFTEALLPELSTEAITKMSDSEFSERAYSWRGKNTVQRNLKLIDRDKKSD